MFFEFSFCLNFFIFMCDVLNVIDLHKSVNMNMLFNNVIKKTLQMILHILKMKERLQWINQNILYVRFDRVKIQSHIMKFLLLTKVLYMFINVIIFVKKLFVNLKVIRIIQLIELKHNKFQQITFVMNAKRSDLMYMM